VRVLGLDPSAKYFDWHAALWLGCAAKQGEKWIIGGTIRSLGSEVVSHAEVLDMFEHQMLAR